MPPRRRSQGDQVELVIEPNRMVSAYLAKQYFDMCKATNAELTCAICLENQQATNNPNVHRCGLSGRQQFPNADLPERVDSAILKGMLGRAVLYKNYWAPIKGTIYAALRIKAAQ
eukprot:1806019-Prymnesium_polylepis.2